MTPAGLPPWPAAPVAHGPVVLRQFTARDVPMAQELSTDPYVPLVGSLPANASREQARDWVSYEEKGAWVYLVTSAGAYAVYLAIIVGRLASTPAAQVPYVAVLLWTTGASIVASIVGRIVIETASPSDGHRSDVRDRDVSRFGEHASRWFLVAGAAAALVLAMVKVDYFWIANVIYLGFVLWAVAGSVLKLVAYRRGL